MIFFGHPAVCSFAGKDGQPLSRAGCTFFPDALPPTKYPELARAEAGAPLLLELPRQGLYSLRTGQQIIDCEQYSILGLAMKNGATIAIERAEYQHKKPRGASQFHFRDPDGKITTKPLDRPRGDDQLRLAYDFLLWREGSPSDHERLFARQLLDESPGLGPVVKLGKASYPALPRGCRTKQAAFHYFPDRRSASGAGEGKLAIYKNENWLPLVSVPKAPEGDLSLSCWDEQLAILHSRTKEQQSELSLRRCNAKACQSEKATISYPEKPANVKVELLGKKVVLVWQAGGALRLKVAPLDQLTQAKERLVLQTEPLAGGFLVHRYHVFAGHQAALLLVHTSRGYFPLRIDGSANVTPMAIVDELNLAL